MDTEDSPAVGTEVALLGSRQAALFDDPTQLLHVSDAEMAKLVADLQQYAKGVMPKLRRLIGLVAWAQWHRLSEGQYAGWLRDIADIMGVHPDTIKTWRRVVTTAGNLVMPPAAAQRAAEQKGARQRASSGETPPPINARAEEASDGGTTDRAREDDATPESPTPAGPSSRVATPSPSPSRGVPAPLARGGAQPGGPARGADGSGDPRAELAHIIDHMDTDTRRMGKVATVQQIQQIRAFATSLDVSRSDAAGGRLTPPSQRRGHDPTCSCALCA